MRSRPRAAFVRANRADPDDPLPLYLFFRSFLGTDTQPTDNALEGLIVVQRAAPQAAEITFTLADEFVRRERLTEAARVLKPLAFAPHENEMTLAARRRLERVTAAMSGEKQPASIDATFATP